MSKMKFLALPFLIQVIDTLVWLSTLPKHAETYRAPRWELGRAMGGCCTALL
jgi:hypothetical protein